MGQCLRQSAVTLSRLLPRFATFCYFFVETKALVDELKIGKISEFFAFFTSAVLIDYNLIVDFWMR